MPSEPYIYVVTQKPYGIPAGAWTRKYELIRWIKSHEEDLLYLNVWCVNPGRTTLTEITAKIRDELEESDG